jgi:hypothetical protein
MVPTLVVPGTLRKSVMDEVRRDARLRNVPVAAKPSAARRRLARPVPRPLLIALGALLVVAVVTVGLTNRSASTRLIPASTAFAPGKAAVELTGARGVLVVAGMPSPPAGKVYEVWIEHGNKAPEPTDALFDVNTRGQAEVAVPGPLRSGDKVLVTAEPPGGASVPTLPLLIEAKLT